MDEKHWKHKIQEQFCEEIEDAHEYLELAEEAEEDGCYQTAHGLELIAHEEMSHANFLREKLIELGMYHHEKDEKWHHLLHKLGYK